MQQSISLWLVIQEQISSLLKEGMVRTRLHVKDQPSTAVFRATLCFQLEIQVQDREPRERTSHRDQADMAENWS